MATYTSVHFNREPLEFDPEVCRNPGPPELVLRVGREKNTVLFFNMNAAQVIGLRLLQWAKPELLEPQYPAPQPVTEPFIDAYTLADEAKRIALASARLLAEEVNHGS